MKETVESGRGPGDSAFRSDRTKTSAKPSQCGDWHRTCVNSRAQEPFREVSWCVAGPSLCSMDAQQPGIALCERFGQGQRGQAAFRLCNLVAQGPRDAKGESKREIERELTLPKQTRGRILPACSMAAQRTKVIPTLSWSSSKGRMEWGPRAVGNRSIVAARCGGLWL
jgi:hypothetical protein